MDYDIKQYNATSVSSTSTPSYSPRSCTTSHACVTLNQTDRLRLLGFDSSVTAVVRTAIKAGWPYGIQQEANYHGAHEFKLNGRPWSGQSSEAVPSRLLMVEVLQALARIGWTLLSSVDISKKPRDKDSLFFALGSPDPSARFFCISFNEYDKLRLICAPPEIIKGAQIAIKECWPIQAQGQKEAKCYQFKLQGKPWWPAADETVKTRLLMLRLLDMISAHGFSVEASIDQSDGQGKTATDTDTLFMRSFRI